MMINKRLIGTVKESKKYIAGNVALHTVVSIGYMAVLAIHVFLLRKRI